MTDILDYISTWSALKWVILVLVAGFIGQFGRMMAEAIIAKLRRRREAKQITTVSPPPEPKPVLPSPAEEGSKTQADYALPLPAEPSVPSMTDQEKSDKKRLKALFKGQKKDAKRKSG